ncbi:hypothetical protein, partial [Arthrobacter sp. H41]|uniref:hypothetical protein n=1 Tax=Arthrobacter sp. H41 TaxID=1312978 RepID=UPI001C1E4ED6
MTATPVPRKARAPRRTAAPKLKLLEGTGPRLSPPAALRAAVGGPSLDWANIPAMLRGEGLAEWQRLAGVFAGEPDRF